MYKHRVDAWYNQVEIVKKVLSVSKIIDITNIRFGRLLVLRSTGSNQKGQKIWLCKCDCGNEKEYLGIRLRNKPPLSCGCDLKKENWKCGGYRDGSGRKVKPLKEKIKYKINDNGCWIWSGSSKSGNGYGRVTYKNQYIGAHRGSFIAYKGEIPKGMLVLHKCDVRMCVNPDHLFLGSQKDNIQDMLKKGRGRYQNDNK